MRITGAGCSQFFFYFRGQNLGRHNFFFTAQTGAGVHTCSRRSCGARCWRAGQWLDFGFIGNVDRHVDQHGTRLAVKQHREAHHTCQDQHHRANKPVFGTLAHRLYALHRRLLGADFVAVLAAEFVTEFEPGHDF